MDYVATVEFLDAEWVLKVQTRARELEKRKMHPDWREDETWEEYLERTL